jgi:hypothetical protein
MGSGMTRARNLSLVAAPVVPRIGTHVCNDDLRHFEFVRNSRLPRDTFKPARMSADAWVFVVCVVGLIVLLVATKTF